MKELSYVLLLGVLMLGVLRRPAVAITAAICLFGLEQWGAASHSSLAANSVFTNYAVGAMVLLGLANRLVKGQCIVCGLPAAYWVVLGLFAYGLATLAWSGGSPAIVHQWQLAFPYVVTFIVLTPMLAARGEDLSATLRWLVLVGGALSVAMLFFAAWGRRGLIIDPHFQSRETNPLAIASVAGQVAVTALLFPVFRSKMLRWAVTLIVALISLAVVMRSGSRGQLLAVLISAAIAWPLLKPGALTWRVIAAPIVLAVIGLLAYVSMDLTTLEMGRWENVDRATSDVDGRLATAMHLLDVSFSSPATLVFGLGNSVAFDVYGIYPHVVPLEILAEEGLIGIGLFGAMLWLAGRSVASAVTLRTLPQEQRAAFVALTAGLIFQFILSLKQGSMLGSPLLFMHAALVARFSVILRKEASRARRAVSPAKSATPVFDAYAAPDVARGHS